MNTYFPHGHKINPNNSVLMSAFTAKIKKKQQQQKTRRMAVCVWPKIAKFEIVKHKYLCQSLKSTLFSTPPLVSYIIGWFPAGPGTQDSISLFHTFVSVSKWFSFYIWKKKKNNIDELNDVVSDWTFKEKKSSINLICFVI